MVVNAETPAAEHGELARFLMLEGAFYRLLTAEEAGELWEIAARYQRALRKIVADADDTDLGEQLLARVAFEALKTAAPPAPLGPSLGFVGGE
jgi:hypothetical protein